MFFWKVSDGDFNVVWRGGRGFSIFVFFSCYNKESVLVIKNFVEEYFML